MRILPAPCVRVLAVAGILAGVPAAAAESNGHPWGLGSYVYYSRGDYGGEEATEIVYWPAVLHHYTERWQFSLTVPFVYMRTPDARTVVVNGEPVVVGAEGSGRETHTGIGDIALKATHHLVDQRGPWPWISLYSRLKVPSGDEDKGLGTGEADVGFGVETVRVFENRVLSFFDAGYTIIGEPPGADFRNRWSLSAGLGYRVTTDTLLATFYNWRSAIVRGGTDPRELSFLATHRVLPELRTFLMIDLGLSAGAADLGAAAGFTHRF